MGDKDSAPHDEGGVGFTIAQFLELHELLDASLNGTICQKEDTHILKIHPWDCM